MADKLPFVKIYTYPREMNLLNRAGGLKYHTKAFMNKKQRWGDFIHHLNNWLESWRPRSKKLLLVGPSGGYCLNDAFLKNFEQVDAIEIDPLARIMFRWRFTDLKLNWDKNDYFSPVDGEFSIDPVLKMLETYPDHAILFTNFLGQLRSLNSDNQKTFEAWQKQFFNNLKKREWASFHDRLSTSTSPTTALKALNSFSELSNEELIENFYSHPDQPLHFIDHCTAEWFESGPRSYFVWPITKDQFHIIEGFTNEAPPESLFSAARHGKLEIIKQLLTSGVDVNTRDNEQSTALICACESGQLECVQFLLQQGADPNLQDHYGATALMFAAQEGLYEEVKVLLEAGARAHLVDKDGDTAMTAAARESYEEIIMLLQKF